MGQMKFNTRTTIRHRAFTLIELLVVIAIIGLLASIVLTAVNKARASSRDAKRMADFNQISTALEEYYQANGSMPANNECGTGGSHFCAGVGDQGATSNDGTGAYEASMQQLVTAGFLATVPEPPDNSDAYHYYNYGSGPEGGLIVTNLETYPASTTGVSPSCRPWPPNVNWCNQSSSTMYCICNTQ
jgi:prepilin-type N-terminal cleavage/methylation domain-containing protein